MPPRTAAHPHLALYQEVPPQEIDTLKKKNKSAEQTEKIRGKSTASTVHIFWLLNRRVWYEPFDFSNRNFQHEILTNNFR